MVDLLETFISELNKYSNKNSIINSISVSNTKKQREKISAEFYKNMKKDIEFYQERLTHLVKSGCESEKILHRWINKVDKLSEKKCLYKKILKRVLTELDDEFDTLNILLQDLYKNSKKCA